MANGVRWAKVVVNTDGLCWKTHGLRIGRVMWPERALFLVLLLFWAKVQPMTKVKPVAMEPVAIIEPVALWGTKEMKFN